MKKFHFRHVCGLLMVSALVMLWVGPKDDHFYWLGSIVVLGFFMVDETIISKK
jgi:hypothetical protein